MRDRGVKDDEHEGEEEERGEEWSEREELQWDIDEWLGLEGRERFGALVQGSRVLGFEG